MKICLLCVELFAWGKYGGFGRSARTLGREYAKRGHEVFAIVPRRDKQKEEEVIDGIKVYGFLRYNPLSAIKYIKKVDADIYHSCEPHTAHFSHYGQCPVKST
jgi:glycogen synthase